MNYIDAEKEFVRRHYEAEPVKDKDDFLNKVEALHIDEGAQIVIGENDYFITRYNENEFACSDASEDEDEKLFNTAKDALMNYKVDGKSLLEHWREVRFISHPVWE